MSRSVFDRPTPKYRFHSRLTTTRAVSGLSARDEPAGQVEPVGPPAARSSSGGRKCGRCGWTTLPDLSIQLPRGRMRISRGGTAWVIIVGTNWPSSSTRLLFERGQLVAPFFCQSALRMSVERLLRAWRSWRRLACSSFVDRQRPGQHLRRPLGRSRVARRRARTSRSGRRRRRTRPGCKSRPACTDRTCGRGIRRSPSSRPATFRKSCARGRPGSLARYSASWAPPSCVVCSRRL